MVYQSQFLISVYTNTNDFVLNITGAFLTPIVQVHIVKVFLLYRCFNINTYGTNKYNSLNWSTVFIYFFLYRIRRSPAWNSGRMRQRFSWGSAINQSRSMMSNLGQLFTVVIACLQSILRLTDIISRRVGENGLVPRWCFDHMFDIRSSIGYWSEFHSTPFHDPRLELPDSFFRTRPKNSRLW